MPLRRISGFALNVQSRPQAQAVMTAQQVTSDASKSEFKGLSNNAHPYRKRADVKKSSLALFAMSEPTARVVNSDQTSESHEFTKVAALEGAQKVSQSVFYESERRNMKTSTKDKFKGSFHEVKGTIKEEVGKITNDPNLKADGKAEKKTGKVQQRIGHAKETVANLKGQLAELKKTG